ncbi:hypothetical protein H2202_000171 [Exophiala xenobiotica]|nr:hypothetical protein H2202_000171 [Exophiala xenobiotica]KAK5208159.1 hypothetical protein LTR41_006095 [Exophiala xenobiotica]KAK5389728.1 hypothetical protein LTR11_000538 [Exophiala xenobiotica]
MHHEHMSDSIKDNLTIILTTSPTPSIPSTELVCGVLESLPPALCLAPLIITFDGFTICQNDNYLDGRLKRGQIPLRMAELYPEYVDNVTKLFPPAADGPTSPSQEVDAKTGALVTHVQAEAGRSVTFIQHQRCQGFALSVKAALSYCATPFVMVLQHDWVFEIVPPFPQLLRILRDEQSDVAYLTFVARHSKRYEHVRGSSNQRFRAVLDAARTTRHGRELDQDLVACLHFYDRPHIATAERYRQIFETNPQLRRGDFLEDVVGTRYSDAIGKASSNEEAVQAWKKIGAWMYAPDGGGLRALRHTSGRTTLTGIQQKARIAAYIEENNRARAEGRLPNRIRLIDGMIEQTSETYFPRRTLKRTPT